jgi:hypothetical protein
METFVDGEGVRASAAAVHHNAVQGARQGNALKKAE